MYILLPPSETKARPEHGTPFTLSALAHPELTEARQTALRAAQRTASGPDAAGKLRIPASRPELVERMQDLPREPAAAALTVYSGVLYDALGEASPTPDREVLITSALFGLVSAPDPIPAYRVSAGSTLSRLGTASSWWRSRLAPIGRRIGESGRVVVDCRSGAYRSMMPVPGSHPVVPVREAADGTRSVISHDAKRYRGLLAAALLQAPRVARDRDEVIELARAAFGAGIEVEAGDRGEIVIVEREAAA